MKTNDEQWSPYPHGNDVPQQRETADEQTQRLIREERRLRASRSQYGTE